MQIKSRDDVSAAQLSHIESTIRSRTNIEQHECSELLDHLQKENDVFTFEQRQHVAKLATTRAETLSAQGGAAIDNADEEDFQDNEHLHTYLPDWLWSILESDDTFDNKNAQFVMFMIKNLGIRKPSGPLKRLMEAILEIASKEAIDPDRAYKRVTEIQEKFALKRKSIPGPATLALFPSDVNIFWTQYPSAYSTTHPPVPCRVDVGTINERNTKACIPLRETNKKVTAQRPRTQASHTSPTFQSHASTDVVQTQNATMQMMLKYMMGSSTSMQLPPSLGTQPSTQPPVERPSSSVNITMHSQPPADAGGIPHCFQAPAHKPQLGSATSASRMAELRAEIAEAAKNEKKKKKGKGNKAPEKSDESDDSDRTRPHDARTSSSETEEDKPSKKRPAKSKAKNAASKKAAKVGKHDFTLNPEAIAILKRPAACKRPKYKQKPAMHAGGRINFAAARGAFRVYLRKGDKVEETVQFQNDPRTAFDYSCALIENDKRPQ